MKKNIYGNLTATGEIEMKDFIKCILELAEKRQVSMEVMNQLPHMLKREIKKNSKRIEKGKAFTVSKRY